MRNWSSVGALSHFQSSSVNCVAIHVLERVDSFGIDLAAWDDRSLQGNSKGRLHGGLGEVAWLAYVTRYTSGGLKYHADQRGHL